MLNLIPIAVSIVVTVLFLAVLKIKLKRAVTGTALIPYACVPAGAAVYCLALAALGYRINALTVSAAVALLTLGVCAMLAFGKRHTDGARRDTILRRMGLTVMIAAALELSVFGYAAFAAPRNSEMPLGIANASADTMISDGDERWLDPSAESRISWTIVPTDVRNVALTFRSDSTQPVQITVAGADRNISVYTLDLYSDTYMIGKGTSTVTVPLSSKGMHEISLRFGTAAAVRLTGVVLNASVPLSPNLLRLTLLTLLLWAGVLIVSFGLHRAEYQPKRWIQRFVTAAAALVCCVFLAMMTFAHIGDGYTQGGLFTPYDGSAYGRDAYYQMFDASQKGQLHLDLDVDERLNTAGELAYDSAWRSQQGVSAQWDRAYYNGKYYSYYGTMPLWVFYYPVYFLTGLVPTTAAACLFFSALCVIFGFMLVFRIARTVIKRTNYLLTLLAAMVLPSVSGIYILVGYGDFYNVPKLCGLAFLLLFSCLSLAGCERPRWYVFLFCGLCAGAVIASRPNMILLAVPFVPLYLGVLVNKEVTVRCKALCVAAFAVPLAAIGAGLLAYNAARFGSPFEFGAKYQLTVNNVAMNNLSLGFLGTAFYHYFIQPPVLTPTFPFLRPQYTHLTTYTRYVYVTQAFGVLSLPLNWSLAAAPALRRRTALRPAYRAAFILSLVTVVLIALLDFAMAGLTISYVCDIAPTVGLVSIGVLLFAEKASRGHAAVHRGVYIGAMILIGLSFFVCLMLLLGTEPYFVRNRMPDIYAIIQNLFVF